MKFICLGHLDEKKWATLSPTEQFTAMDECFAYDEILRKNGHFAGGEALDHARRAVTIRWNGGPSVTDGPYAESKEMLGGILFLEARDMAHAIELMSKHPGIKMGPFEIRPAADLAEMVRQSAERRAAKAKG